MKTEKSKGTTGAAWSRRSIERDRARFETRVGERQKAWMRIKDISRALAWVRDGYWHALDVIGVRESDLQLLDLVNKRHELTDAGRAVLGGDS